MTEASTKYQQQVRDLALRALKLCEEQLLDGVPLLITAKRRGIITDEDLRRYEVDPRRAVMVMRAATPVAHYRRDRCPCGHLQVCEAREEDPAILSELRMSRKQFYRMESDFLNLIVGDERDPSSPGFHQLPDHDLDLMAEPREEAAEDFREEVRVLCAAGVQLFEEHDDPWAGPLIRDLAASYKLKPESYGMDEELKQSMIQRHRIQQVREVFDHLGEDDCAEQYPALTALILKDPWILQEAGITPEQYERMMEAVVQWLEENRSLLSSLLGSLGAADGPSLDDVGGLRVFGIGGFGHHPMGNPFAGLGNNPTIH